MIFKSAHVQRRTISELTLAVWCDCGGSLGKGHLDRSAKWRASDFVREANTVSMQSSVHISYIQCDFYTWASEIESKLFRFWGCTAMCNNLLSYDSLQHLNTDLIISIYLSIQNVPKIETRFNVFLATKTVDALHFIKIKFEHLTPYFVAPWMNFLKINTVTQSKK